MKETEKIKERYSRRDKVVSKGASIYSECIVRERNRIYSSILDNYFPNKKTLTFLEIGAGTGANLNLFKEAGILSSHLSANELLAERVLELKKNHPDIRIFEGDALAISKDEKFDIIFQSTVFTSILDSSFRKELADKMWSMLNLGGIIIWYDFIYDNPKNPDVKKVSVKELRSLFPSGQFVFGKKVTLAPPIGRRVGKLYPFFNLFPFLRSHYIAVIQKK